MDIWNFDSNKFLKCGVDVNTITAIQLRRGIMMLKVHQSKGQTGALMKDDNSQIDAPKTTNAYKIGQQIKAEEQMKTAIFPGTQFSPLDNDNILMPDNSSSTEPSTSYQHIPTTFDVGNAEVTQAIILGVSACALFHYFDEINQTAIKTLCECVVAKLDRMCQQLQILGNRKKRGRPISFNNPVHQVLHAHLMPTQNLFEFYHSRVIKPCQAIAEKHMITIKGVGQTRKNNNNDKNDKNYI